MVFDRVMGDPPGDPPADVPELDEEAPAAKKLSLKQQLEDHENANPAIGAIETSTHGNSIRGFQRDGQYIKSQPNVTQKSRAPTHRGECQATDGTEDQQRVD